MHYKEYSSFKKIPTGRFEDSTGSYEVIARMTFSNKKKVEEGFNELAKIENRVFAYEFAGEGAYEYLEQISRISEKSVGRCSLLTNAPMEKWGLLQTKQHEWWRSFEKIVIQRLSIDDEENDALLGVKAIPKALYEQMSQFLTNRISFLVDVRHSSLKKKSECIKFIDFAQKLGIKEVVFLDDEEEIINFQNKLKEEARNTQHREQELIKALRERNFKSKFINNERLEIDKPLMWKIQRTLLREGYHLHIAKTISEEDRNFFNIITLKKDGYQVVFKTKITSGRQKAWCNSRSHKFVWKIK